MSVRYTAEALVDIDKILEGIQRKSLMGARNVSLAFGKAAEACTQFPRASPKIGKTGVHRHPVGKYAYTMYYRVDLDGAGIEILKVVRSARVRNLRRMPRSP